LVLKTYIVVENRFNGNITTVKFYYLSELKWLLMVNLNIGKVITNPAKSRAFVVTVKITIMCFNNRGLKTIPTPVAWPVGLATKKDGNNFFNDLFVKRCPGICFVVFTGFRKTV
jgi:hypothetical protein